MNKGINKLREAKLSEGWKPIAKKNVKYKDKTGTYNWEIESGIDTDSHVGKNLEKGVVPKIILHYQHEDETGYPSSGGQTIWLKHKNDTPYTPQEAKALVNKISNKKIGEFHRKSRFPNGSGQNVFYVDGKFLREGKLNEEKYIVASIYGDLYTPKAVSEKKALKLMMKIADQYAGDKVFMLGVKAWNKPHKFNKKKIKVKEGVLLEKKELPANSVKKIAQMTDRNNHTEARIVLSKLMGWKKGEKFYNAMKDINDVFNGYPGPASKLNEMMEQQLYKQMYRTWSNYDDIYNSL